MKKSNDQQRYLATSAIDEEWGIVVTTIGYQFVPPRVKYPLSSHPDHYSFKPQHGRVLNEYQLVYITKGSGIFSSKSYKMKQEVTAGTMMILFPGEWHSYYPDSKTGWDEYWVGFRGSQIDQRIEKHFFSRKEPLHQIGLSATIVDLYKKILEYASQERAGYQQVASSMVLYMLGAVYYKKRNTLFTNTYVIDKINEARILMKENVEEPLRAEEISARLGLGYSWFRRMFKEYTGVSPTQYQLQLRLLRAKELLSSTDMNISEIAYHLRFENAGQFSTFFKKKEGITPTEFREGSV